MSLLMLTSRTLERLPMGKVGGNFKLLIDILLKKYVVVS